MGVRSCHPCLGAEQEARMFCEVLLTPGKILQWRKPSRSRLPTEAVGAWRCSKPERMGP